MTTRNIGMIAAGAAIVLGLAGAAAGALIWGPDRSDAAALEALDPNVIQINWRDLAPKPQTVEEQDAVDRMNAALAEFMGGPIGMIDGPGPGVLAHGALGGYVISEELVPDYDNKRVRMPGYALPLEWNEAGVTEFLLVPFVGACLHVPPPPANQIVLIKTETPYRPREFFEPVNVTGLFSRFQAETESIESGYKIVAERISPYEDG
ncbi:MAG: DUF3299 domain-containing protein [Pseudomonadota bacterium]